MSWTDERVAMLRKLNSEGYSCSQIAAQLGLVTRNAVIGKMHRIGIQANRETMKRKRVLRVDERRNNGCGKRSERVSAAKKLSPARALLADCQPLPPPQETDIARVTFDQMADDQSLCKWPVGEPTVGFCGAASVAGLPYCTHHVKRASSAWQPTMPSQAPSRGVAMAATVFARGDGEYFDRVDELLKADA